MNSVSKFYPVFLDLEEKKVLVIGAGAIAAQKIENLLRTRAKIVVVAKRADPIFYRWYKQKKIVLQLKSFVAADLAKCDLVFCATDNETLNARVSGLCRVRKLWVNVVDRFALCDFIVPAVSVQGSLVAAISSAGASPVLARVLRDQVQQILKPHVGYLAQVLQQQRVCLKTIAMQDRKKMLEAILTPKALLSLEGKKKAQIAQWLQDQFKNKFGINLKSCC